MIYKVYLIDENGISLLETTFRDLDNIPDETIPNYFKIINKTIDNIQEAMAKGKIVKDLSRVMESEESTIAIYYHQLSKVLFCSISDADDDTKKIKEVIKKIGHRFWKKHQSDLENFRTTAEKKRFQTFTADVENLTLGGRIAEVFPNLLIGKSVLEKILTMGMIDEVDLQVALKCNGKRSPLRIARSYEKNRNEITDVLKKLEKLDIIKY